MIFRIIQVIELKKVLIILRSLKESIFVHLNVWDVNTPRESCCFCCQVAQTSHISHLANIPHSRALVSSKASLAVQKVQKNRDLVRISESFVDNNFSLYNNRNLILTLIRI